MGNISVWKTAAWVVFPYRRWTARVIFPYRRRTAWRIFLYRRRTAWVIFLYGRRTAWGIFPYRRRTAWVIFMYGRRTAWGIFPYESRASKERVSPSSLVNTSHPMVLDKFVAEHCPKVKKCTKINGLSQNKWFIHSLLPLFAVYYLLESGMLR